MNDWHMELPPRKLYTDQQVRELISKTQSGDTVARDTLIESNLRLVSSITNRFKNRGFEMEDLFQIGCIGLVKSIDNFNLAYDVKFSTYAVPKIIGEIKRYIRETSTLHVSRSLKELASKGIATKDKLTLQLGRTPLINEIATELGCTNEELIVALDSVAPVLSLQQVVHETDGDSLTLGEQIADQQNDTIFYLQDIIDRLNSDERKLVMLRYFSEKSQTQVAVELGISQAQVSRLEKRILQDLRQNL